MDYETKEKSNCGESISKPNRIRHILDPCPFRLGGVGVPASSCIVRVLQ